MAMGPVAIDYRNGDAGDDGSDVLLSSHAPSFIQNLPEFVKLILASLFVAFVVHAFFASRRSGSNDGGGPIVRGRVGSVGISARSDGDDGSAENDAGMKKDTGQILGSNRSETQTAVANKINAKSRPKKKLARNPVADRNYDALVCKTEDKEEKRTSLSEMSEHKSGSDISSSGKENNQKQSSSKAISKVKKHTPRTSKIEDETIGLAAVLTEPPPIQLRSNASHPGLQGYYNWNATITSLYRIYAIPSYDSHAANINNESSNAYHQAILPMHPSSERGQVPLHIEVTNRTSHPRIDVYWIDYKGNEVHKGSIPYRGGTWAQTTFVGHPWTFRVGDGEQNILLKYAPFRIVPTIVGAETSRVESNGNIEGMQNFVIRDVPGDNVSRLEGSAPVCCVEDKILPEPPLIPASSYPSTTFTSSEMQNAIEWSCQQIQREDAIYHGKGIASAKRLLQYLKNICLCPDAPKYRRLRLGNRIFRETIYDTGARGVLLALGFEELYGHMECGPGGGKMLAHERIQQISDAMMAVDRTLKIMEGKDGVSSADNALAQPNGGDGFGRAGFGHAGGMNL